MVSVMSWKRNYNTMPWLCTPYIKYDKVYEKYRTYRIGGMPTVIILNKDRTSACEISALINEEMLENP